MDFFFTFYFYFYFLLPQITSCSVPRKAELIFFGSAVIFITLMGGRHTIMFSEHNLQLHGSVLISRSNTVQFSSEVYCSALYFFNYRQAAKAEISIF